jgi:hypothetical protein
MRVAYVRINTKHISLFETRVLVNYKVINATCDSQVSQWSASSISALTTHDSQQEISEQMYYECWI